MINRTMALNDAFCPKCNQWGQRKYRKHYHQVYEEFDHYQTLKGKPSKLHHNYKYSCYIGKVTESDLSKVIKP